MTDMHQKLQKSNVFNVLLTIRGYLLCELHNDRKSTEIATNGFRNKAQGVKPFCVYKVFRNILVSHATFSPIEFVYFVRL